MVFSVSPSVKVREVDLTSVIPAISSTQAAIAGVFNWGPVGERQLITSEEQLASVFGKPTDDNYETWFTAANFLSYSNTLYAVRVENNALTAGENDSLSDFQALYPGAIGNSIEVAYVTDADAYEETIFTAGELGRIKIDDDGNPNTAPIDSTEEYFNETTIEFLANEDRSADFVEGDIVRIGSSSLGYQSLRLKQDSVASEVTYDGGVTTYWKHTFVFEDSDRYLLTSFNVDTFTIEKLWGYSFYFGSAPASGQGHFIVVDKDGDITGAPYTVLEKYESLGLTPGDKLDDGTNNYFFDVINDRSQYIAVKDASENSIGVDPKVVSYTKLSGGTNGDSESDVTFGNLAQGYDLFKSPEEIDIAFVLQGKAHKDSPNLANYIIGSICETRRDCVAFLSPHRDALIDAGGKARTNYNQVIDSIINNYRNFLQASSYWFLDSGYKYRYDKYNDKYRWVPLNGDIAGLAAKVQPWESPAGYKRGIIRNVVKIAFSPNKEQRDLLYGRDINPVINVTGQGTLLFGDKTGLGRPSAFDRLNVRRLFIVVEKAIATVSNSFLFDFNDEFTQTEFTNLVEPFLRDIKGRRGITDFRVVADSRVNTPDVIDRNMFRANIFIKPARSINFIELTFIATRTGISFEEIVGQQF